MEKLLNNMKCIGCEGGIHLLTEERLHTLLQQVPLWQLSSDHKKISRSFSFKGFTKTMAFVNAIAQMAQQEAHHPDMEVSYNRCIVHYTTHAVQGLTENDFICAAKVDILLSEPALK